MDFSTMYYWFVVLDRIYFVSCAATVFSLFLVFAWVIYFVEGIYSFRRVAIVGTCLFVMFGTVALFTPDKETMIVMYAGDKVQSILNSDKARVVGDKAYRVLETAMDEYLKKNEKGKENGKH